jgi:biopolymer transport protein ExbD
MAEIAESGGGGHGKGGKKRAKKQSTRVDMTPMVDLAFLLLTFFVLTATFSKNKAMEVTFPAPPDKNIEIPPVSNAVTFLLTKDDRIFYYEEEFDAKDAPPTVLKEIGYSCGGPNKVCVRELLQEKNKGAFEAMKALDEEREKTNMADSTYKKRLASINKKNSAVTVILKSDDKAKYRNMVALIDELKVMKITKFVNVDITMPEFERLKTVAP